MTDETVDPEILAERRARANTERENREVRRIVREVTPLWQRIQVRRQQNGFGEDYEIALTRRA